MNLLAIDTSTDACSVALGLGDVVSSRHEIKPRQHTRLLVPMIDGLLADAGISASDLDGVVLGGGPGSFIGVRIAASVAQGFCFANGCPLLPVSSLAAVAAVVFESGELERVLVAQDARMNELYFAGFEADGSRLPVATVPARLQAVATLTEVPSGYAAAGAGWDRHPQLLAALRGQLAAVTDVRFPHAAALLRLARPQWDKGMAIAPESLTLDYLRDRVASVPNDARGAAGGPSSGAHARR